MAADNLAETLGMGLFSRAKLAAKRVNDQFCRLFNDSFRRVGNPQL